MTPQRQARRHDDRGTGRFPRCAGRHDGGQSCKMPGPRILAECDNVPMRKRLPTALLTRTPVEKLVWLYVDKFPGEHSGESLETALGVYANRALAALVKDGLLVEEEAPAARKAGKYRAVTAPPMPAPAQEREEEDQA